METLIILGFVFFATMSVFGFIDVMRQINKIPDEIELQKEEKNETK